MDFSGFSISQEDAVARYANYGQVDPFPGIQSALLNSADVCDYVRMTGMVYPFYPDEDHLKSASYEVAILGLCIYWDHSGKRQERTLGVGEKFSLIPNSIAFVEVEPTFRLPSYIALRFNLKISHVHRGILLGTGPLVDPGYEGKLVIPLHNLTTNDYVFTGGEALIWVEFTKISNWIDLKVSEDCMQRHGKYYEFPKDKKYMEPNDFLAKAAPNREIRSSMSELIELANTAARQAQEARIRTQQLIGIGMVSVIIGFLALSVSLGFLYINLNKFVNESIMEVKREITNNSERLSNMEGKP